jgi:hypothetical protein
MLTKLLRTIRERREAREEEHAALEAVARLRELARREAEGPAAGALRRGSYSDELERFRLQFHEFGLTDSRGRLTVGDRLALRFLLALERAAERWEARRARR